MWEMPCSIAQESPKPIRVHNATRYNSGTGPYEIYIIPLNILTECAGVRIIGYPEMDANIDGMDTPRYFVSCVELDVRYTRSDLIKNN